MWPWVPVELQCKDCEMWYGAEDDGYGPCSIKHARGDDEYLTYGFHDCDEDEWLEALEKREETDEEGRGMPTKE